MKLRCYIGENHGSLKGFADAQGVKPQQVTQWMNKGFIVIDDVLFSPRRVLKLRYTPQRVLKPKGKPE